MKCNDKVMLDALAIKRRLEELHISKSAVSRAVGKHDCWLSNALRDSVHHEGVPRELAITLEKALFVPVGALSIEIKKTADVNEIVEGSEQPQNDVEAENKAENKTDVSAIAILKSIEGRMRASVPFTDEDVDALEFIGRNAYFSKVGIGEILKEQIKTNELLEKLLSIWG